MSRKPTHEADPWWRLITQEFKLGLEDEGLYTRVVIQPGVSKNQLTIQAEIWESNPEHGSRRLYVYSREYPHGDHNFFSGACWQAIIKVWNIHDSRADAQERRVAEAEGSKMRKR